VGKKLNKLFPLSRPFFDVKKVCAQATAHQKKEKKPQNHAKPEGEKKQSCLGKLPNLSPAPYPPPPPPSIKKNGFILT